MINISSSLCRWGGGGSVNALNATYKWIMGGELS